MHEINKLLFRMKAKPNEHLPINEAEVGFLTVSIMSLFYYRIIVEKILLLLKLKELDIKKE